MTPTYLPSLFIARLVCRLPLGLWTRNADDEIIGKEWTEICHCAYDDDAPCIKEHDARVKKQHASSPRPPLARITLGIIG